MKMTTEEFKAARKRSSHEATLEAALKRAGVTGFVTEFQFARCIDRKWRSDFAWRDRGVLVEVDGGSYRGGRHQSFKGFQADCEKHNAAAMLGYRVLRYTGADIEKRIDEVVEQIKAVLS